MKVNESLATRKQETFAARLRKVVKEYPISARQWSVAAGKSSSQVGVLIKRHSENVGAKFEDETVRALANAVGCTFEWLAHGEGEMTLNNGRKDALRVSTPLRGVASTGVRSVIKPVASPPEYDPDARREQMMRILREHKFDIFDIVLAFNADRFDRKIVNAFLEQRERFASLSREQLLARLDEVHVLVDRARDEVITSGVYKMLP